MRLLRDLVNNRGQTVVIVTHDMGVAASADRIIHVRDGLIESDEVPEAARLAASKAR
jgi:putative ABC transport system ATP-binding protein